MTPYEKAAQRVNQWPALDDYHDIILDYDWPNADEHYEWVATANVKEILEWAEGIREGETE